MRDIIDLVLEYKTNPKDSILQEIFLSIAPLIHKKLKKIDSRFHEDMKQEFFLGIVSVIRRLELRCNVLQSYCFNEKNKEYLEYHEYSLSSIYSLFPNQYLINFLKENGTEEFKNAFYNKDIKKFNSSFGKFNMRNQFLSIIERRLNSIVASFYRQNKEKIFFEVFSLNQINSNGIESLNEISSPNCKYILNLEQYGILAEDISFLELFIENNTILTQQEVSKKIGKSQQYVSKKIQKLRKKYQGRL